jgi:sec-independent protein translocase protein TatA
MGSFSVWHILLVVLVFVVLFGSGKISGLMGDVAKGIKAFKAGLAEDKDGSNSTEAETRLVEQQAQTLSMGRTRAASRIKSPVGRKSR